MYFAIAKQAVNPGDSIPSKFIKPGKFLSFSSQITKSLKSAPLCWSFGRIPDWSGDKSLSCKEGKYLATLL
jgi:hypothetical protein